MVRAGYGCISCIIDDVVGALLPLVQDDAVRRRVIDVCLQYLHDDFSLDQVPSIYITGVHRILKQITGIPVPYALLRTRCNEIGREIADKVARRVERLPEFEAFSLLVRWAIAGNELDFRTVGTGYEIDIAKIEDRLQQCVDRPLVVDDLVEIHECLERAHRILYIPDNVGELAFDLLLVDRLISQGKEVYLPLRGGPITSDATLDDGFFFNASARATDIFRAGPDTLGILFHEMSERLSDELQRADVIVCKGQANFYSFSEYGQRYPGTIVSLLRTKCDLVSRYFGQQGKINVASLLKR